MIEIEIELPSRRRAAAGVGALLALALLLVGGAAAWMAGRRPPRGVATERPGAPLTGAPWGDAPSPRGQPDHGGAPVLEATTPGAVRARFGAVGTRHLERINAIAYAPDGATIATVSHDRTLRLTDRAGGAPPRVVDLDGRIAWATAFGPEGRRLIAGTNGGELLVLDATTGASLRRFDARPRVYGAGVVRSRNAAAAFTAHPNRPRPGMPRPDYPHAGSLVLFDLDSGAVLWKVSDVHSVGLASFSRDGRFAFAVGLDEGLRAFDLVEQRELPATTIPAISGSFARAAMTPDGGRLWYAEGSDGIRPWDRRARRAGSPLPESDGLVSALAVSDDGRRLAAIASRGRGEGYELRLWDLESPALLHRLPVPDAYEPALVFSPDGREVAVGASPYLLRVSVETGRPIDGGASHEGVPSLLAVDATGERIATATDKAGPYVWDAATGASISTPGPRSNHIRGLAFSPDGTRLLALAPNGPALYPVPGGPADEGPHISTDLLPERADEFATPEVTAQGFASDDEVWVAVTEDAHSYSGPGTSHLLRLRAGEGWERLGKRAPPKLPVHDLVLTDGGSVQLGVGLGPAPGPGFSFQGEGWVHEVDLEFVPGRGPIRVVRGALSQDGTRAALAFRDGRLEVWDTREGTRRVRREGALRLTHASAAPALAWSPDGALLATTGEDGSVTLWDTTDLAPRRVLRGHEGPVVAATFLGADALVSLGADGAGLIWSL